MYRVGVIGDRESILGFSALGLDIFPCSSPSEIEALLAATEKMEQYSVLYITENAAKDCIPSIVKYRSKRTPAIILIPGKSGPLGLGMDDVKRSVEKAVGADILFK